MQQIFHQEPKETLLSRFTKIIAWFMGSWWGVVTHTAWFAYWITSGQNMELLTLWVSLEAIFLGIFLLMASNRAEEDRDRKEALERQKQLVEVKADVGMDKKQLEELSHIKSSLNDIQKQLNSLKHQNSK